MRIPNPTLRVLPFVLLAMGLTMGVAFLVLICVILAPLLPFAVIALIVWAAMRASRPAYAG